MNRNGLQIIGFLLILVPSLAFSQVVYDAEKELISVKSEGSLLTEILSEISESTGIEIYINPSVDKQVFVNIERQPLEKSIKRMIKPLNNVMIYEGPSIVAVKIFEKSHAESTLKITPVSSQLDEASPYIEQRIDEDVPASETSGEAVAKEEKAEPLPPHLMQGHEEEFQSLESPKKDGFGMDRRKIIPPHLMEEIEKGDAEDIAIIEGDDSDEKPPPPIPPHILQGQQQE